MSEPDWAKFEAIVGPRWPAYRGTFQRFSRGGWWSWNWAAFFATLAWLRYRKLYLWSWLYFPLSSPVLIAWWAISRSGADACESALSEGGAVWSTTLALALLAASWLMPPLLANRLYFRRVQSLVAQDAEPEATGSVWGALLVPPLVLPIALAGAPSFGNYRYRTFVADGVMLASAAQSALQQQLGDQGQMPRSIEDLNVATSSKYVHHLVLDPDGTLTAVFGDAAPALAGHSISLTPRRDEVQIVSWQCHSENLPKQCLPRACRM